MKHIQQPKNSNMCGQAIIAMLGNMTLYDAIKLLNTKGCTNTKMMAMALKDLNYQCENKLKRVSKNYIRPKCCILHLRFNGNKGGHWSLWNGHEKLFYDPAFSKPINNEDFYIENGAKITSYLEICQ